MDVGTIFDVKGKYEGKLLGKRNVVGVGLGSKVVGGEDKGIHCITVNVTKKLPLSDLRKCDVVPTSIKGYMTDVVEVGEILALDIDPKARTRPIEGGMSVGHFRITAGTLGCVVKDVGSGRDLLLSNNHVFADTNAAQLYDPVLQPGPYDGGSLAHGDVVGNLARFERILFEGETEPVEPDCKATLLLLRTINYVLRVVGSRYRFYAMKGNLYLDSAPDVYRYNVVDAAVAQPKEKLGSGYLRDVLEIGGVSGFALARVGMKVRKFGRSSGLTSGLVRQDNVTLKVGYGQGRVAWFKDQLILDCACKPGDSGSLIVSRIDNGNKAVGLLFAGSEKVTVANHALQVRNRLGVTI